MDRVVKAHWGEFTIKDSIKKDLTTKETIPINKKIDQLRQLQDNNGKKSEPIKATAIKIEGEIVTQTIEVMKKTEVVQSLIETYTSNNNGTPWQVMPNILYPSDINIDLVSPMENKITKPIWYVPPISSSFYRGDPVEQIVLSKQLVEEAIRKSVSGLLRLRGFNECTESALTMMTDGVDEFFKSFMETILHFITKDNSRLTKELDIPILERSYYELTKNSLISIHNYYRNEICNKNRTEHKELDNIFQRYDHLMQQSQHLKAPKPEDYINSSASTSSTATLIRNDGGYNNVTVMNLLDGCGENQNFTYTTNVYDQTNINVGSGGVTTMIVEATGQSGSSGGGGGNGNTMIID